MKNKNLTKNIIVNATALKSGGGLSILQQFLSHVPEDNITAYYVFIPPNLNAPLKKKNVFLIHKDTNSFIKRVYWDSKGMQRWLEKKNIVAHLLISLQNTSLFYKKEIPKIIYLHQGIPLHPQKWSFFNLKELKLAFYKHIYPFFIFMYVDKRTKFIVQTEWMKEALISKFKQRNENIYVIKPDILKTDIAHVPTIELPHKYTLFYPATSAQFKNHRELIYALNAMKNNGININQVGLYLTFNSDEDQKLFRLINTLGLNASVHFVGNLSYEQVLVYYKSCTTVVFPSYIESFGLPLLEAALFAKPLVAIDEDYAKEVISGYPGVLYAPMDSPEKWKDAILQSFAYKNLTSYNPNYEATWDYFFKKIYELIFLSNSLLLEKRIHHPNGQWRQLKP